MRRSPPALSCLIGLDLRKRPFADLTPEEAGDVVERTVAAINSPEKQVRGVPPVFFNNY